MEHVKESKIRDAIDKAKEKVSGFFNKQKARAEIWWSRNKDWAVVGIPIAAGAIGTGVKYVLRAHNIKREENLKYKSYWDASKGHHWELKRKPTNKERLEIDYRWKTKGEPLGQVLVDMNLI